MLNIHFAPLQGYTDYTYRLLHHQSIGGVKSYTTPFLRYEHHEVRNKDRNDILSANNIGLPIVPQIIAADKSELCPLTELLLKEGYTRIDINLGCAFPMQTRQQRGAGLLPHPKEVEALLNAAKQYPEVTWSVKMRLGLDNADECKALIPLFNAMNLNHITLHPRTGRDGFNGSCDETAFGAFASVCRHSVWWSGNIESLEMIHHLEETFPTLTDVMIGRGLLARPSLAVEYAQDCEWTMSQRIALALKMHDALYAEMQQRLQGPSQLLSRMQSYWEYQSAIMPKKIYKGLMKSRDIIRYTDAIDELRKL